jgi:hypothetical protein
MLPILPIGKIWFDAFIIIPFSFIMNFKFLKIGHFYHIRGNIIKHLC